MDLLSIIVPIYNTPRRLLVKCCESLNNISKSNIEIILVDDGSTEDVKAYLTKYLKLSNFKYFRIANGGVSGARNFGLEKSHGDWVMFVDADDYITFDMSVFHNIDDSVDVIMFPYYITGKQVIKKNIQNIIGKNGKQSAQDVDLISKLLKIQNRDFRSDGFFLGTPWGKVFRKQFLDSNRIRFNTSIYRREDALFNVLVYRKMNSFYGMDAKDGVYHYRISSVTSVSNGFDPMAKKNHGLLISKMKQAVQLTKSHRYMDPFSLYVFDLVTELLNVDFCNEDNTQSFSSRRKEFIGFMDNEDIKANFIYNPKTFNLALYQKVLYLLEYRRLFLIINLYMFVKKVISGSKNRRTIK
ncbi:glycosyltransferase family A protein [Lactiplantibacillus plantarum]|uniref:glycosyltransferase family A protein n=1 Tax=Lactiplantibacillus plantarum TaxID=1590 RepID=UPI003F52F6AE